MASSVASVAAVVTDTTVATPRMTVKRKKKRNNREKRKEKEKTATLSVDVMCMMYQDCMRSKLWLYGLSVLCAQACMVIRPMYTVTRHIHGIIRQMYADMPHLDSNTPYL